MPASFAVNPDPRSSPTLAPLAVAWLMLSMTTCASSPTQVRLMILETAVDRSFLLARPRQF